MRWTATCFVSDELRFIYIKTAKTAGSSILLGWIKPSVCPPRDEADKQMDFGGTVYSKSCPEERISGSECDKIPIWKWYTYFVFAAIRDPYARLVSSYTYCKIEGSDGIAWADFCRDPSLPGHCFGEAQPAHTRNRHIEYPVRHAYYGWYGWHIDYAMRVESLTEDMAHVARTINARADGTNATVRLNVPESDIQVNMKRDVDRNAAAFLCEKWYSGANAHCVDALERTQDPRVLCYASPCMR